MPAAVTRSKTPVSADSNAAAVEPNSADDLTQPEVALPVRRTPLQSTIPELTRSRKKTLVSPIPALLAAQMVEIREDRSDATPIPVELRGDATSRFATSDQEALLNAEEHEDYVVEVVDGKKGAGGGR